MKSSEFRLTGKSKLILSERLTLWICAVLLILSSWGYGGGIYWAPLALIGVGVMGMVTVVVLLIGRRQSVEPLTRRFLLLTLPVWVMWALMLFGSLNPALMETTVDGQDVYLLSEPVSMLPTTARPDLMWRHGILVSVLYIAAVTLYLAADRRRTLRVISWIGIVNAALLAAFGLLQARFDSDGDWYYHDMPSDSYFSMFPHPEHWVAFALLWAMAALAEGFYQLRRLQPVNFVRSQGLWAFLAALLIWGSIFRTDSDIGILLAYLVFAFVIIQFAHDFFKKFSQRVVVGVFIFAVGAIAFAAVTIWLLKAVYDIQVAVPERLAMYSDVWSMIRERPLFGWGVASFPTVFLFFSENDFHNELHMTAHSDWLQLLAEVGVVGLLVVVAAPLALLWRSARARTGNNYSNYVLSACFLIVVLALVDVPFQSPAVLFSFMLLFLLAIRYGEIYKKRFSKLEEDDGDGPKKKRASTGRNSRHGLSRGRMSVYDKIGG